MPWPGRRERKCTGGVGACVFSAWGYHCCWEPSRWDMWSTIRWRYPMRRMQAHSTGCRTQPTRRAAPELQQRRRPKRRSSATNLTVTPTNVYVCTSAVGGTQYSTGSYTQAQATAKCPGRATTLLEFIQVLRQRHGDSTGALSRTAQDIHAGRDVCDGSGAVAMVLMNAIRRQANGQGDAAPGCCELFIAARLSSRSGGGPKQRRDGRRGGVGV